jgi:uncharacterized protein (TIGR03435 family)
MMLPRASRSFPGPRKKAARLARAGLVLLLLSLLPPFFPRAAAQKPAFAVATIRPTTQSVKFEHDGTTEFAGNTLRMQDVTVATCLKLAYHIQDRQIAGPDWLQTERFDITAKADDSIDEDTMNQMLQSLLADRFNLTFHREQRQMKVIVLTAVGSHPGLKPAIAQDAKPFRQNSANGTVAKSMPIGEFADFLSGPLQIPVVDHTGLAGKYDFVLDFTPYLPDPARNMDGTRPDTTAILKAAMQDELGIKMTGSTAPVEVLVIDHVEKPSQN